MQSAGSKAGRGKHTAGAVFSDQNNNIIGGAGAGEQLDRGGGLAPSATGQNIVIGAGAGSLLKGADFGNVLVGRSAGKLNNANTTGYNTCIGDGAGSQEFFSTATTTYTGCTAIGRSAGAGWTNDVYTTSIGHGSMFKGGANTGVVALGDTAGGAAIAGTASWQGTALTYFAANNDLNCSYIGRFTGKASTSARTNSHAIGHLAQIPVKDNVMVLGHGLVSVVSTGRMYDGWARVNSTSTVGINPIATLTAGVIVRSGALAGAVNDTTDTAANLVAAGPGTGSEYCSIEFSYANNTSGGFNVTIVGGTNVAVSGLGLGGVITPGTLAKFRLNFDNCLSGTEACTLYRVG